MFSKICQKICKKICQKIVKKIVKKLVKKISQKIIKKNPYIKKSVQIYEFASKNQNYQWSRW